MSVSLHVRRSFVDAEADIRKVGGSAREPDRNFFRSIYERIGTEGGRGLASENVKDEVREMTYAQIDKQRAVPWWAIFGAPLVGVPVVVALLALAAPEQQAVTEQNLDFAAEQVEIDSVGLMLKAQGPSIPLPWANS